GLRRADRRARSAVCRGLSLRGRRRDAPGMDARVPVRFGRPRDARDASGGRGRGSHGERLARSRYRGLDDDLPGRERGAGVLAPRGPGRSHAVHVRPARSSRPLGAGRRSARGAVADPARGAEGAAEPAGEGVSDAETLEDLVRAARSGDRESLERLVLKVQDRVHGLAVRMLWNPDDARDATQEILVRIVTRLGTFRGGSSFATWVYRVAA